MIEPAACTGCGEGHVEVTTFGENTRRWLSLCRCPQPACPCCEKHLEDGYCVTLGCAIDGNPVPIPVLA